jgi:large subunit ribosomal protein L16
MGSGKGSPEYWVAVVKPGRIMFEIAGVDEETSRQALKLAGYKLPIRTKIVTRAESDAIKAAAESAGQEGKMEGEAGEG